MSRNVIKGRSAAEVAASIEQAIHQGQFAPGDPLPPVRHLAQRLGLSPVTVAASYRLLRSRGLAFGAGRRGTRVVSRSATLAASATAPTGDGLTDLTSGNPDPDLLPSLDSALRSIDGHGALYGQSATLRPLLTFLQQEFDGDGIPSGAICVVGGALDGIERVLREHLRPGDLVAVEDPSYPGILDLLSAGGLRRTPFQVDDEGPVPSAFEEATQRASAVIVTPRGQNPYGSALSAARATELRGILKRQPRLLLVENDPLGGVSGAPPLSLTGHALGRWAVIRSTSKFLGPDLRLAAMAGDELTIARVEGRQAVGTRWVSTILQRLALALWSDPSSGRLLARAADVYRLRRQTLVEALEARGLTAHGRSGFNVWIPVRDEHSAVRLLAEKGWAVMPGERFRLGSGPAIRVTTSVLDRSGAEQFATDLAGAPSRALGFA